MLSTHDILERKNGLRKTRSLPDVPTEKTTLLKPEIPEQQSDEYYEKEEEEEEEEQKEEQPRINTIQKPPNWVTSTTKSNRYDYMNVLNPGSKECPLLFKNEKFEDVVFLIEDNCKCIRFEDCTFTRSQVWGDLTNVSIVHPKYIQPEYCNMDIASVFKTPGSKQSPLIFQNITFPYLNFNMDIPVYALFKECLFYSTRKNGFSNCVFDHCIYSEKNITYDETPLAFYVNAVSPVAKTPVIYGRVVATPVEQPTKIKKIKRDIWSSFKKFKL